jgi:DNA-binding response OmpR family regulator
MEKKVLIVDDEQDVLDALEVRLVKEGYTVIKASNGSDAVLLARKERPDLILLDIMMPVMDGSKTAEKLREDFITKDIPIMFLTCLVTPEEEKHGLKEVGGNFFIAKPYNPQELLGEIKKRIA